MRRRSNRSIARCASLAVVAVVALATVPRARAHESTMRARASRWIDDAVARGDVDLSDGVEPLPRTKRDDVVDGGARRLGLTTTRAPVETMEAYARVAWNATLHPSRYSPTEGLGAALASLRSSYGSDDKMALIVCLLYERYEMGEASAFADYFRSGPEEFDTPSHWSDDTAKELRGSDAYERDIVDEFKLLNTVSNALRMRVFDVYTDVFKSSAARTVPALRWAWTLAHARATRVSGKEGLALVPVLDMIRECAPGAEAPDAAANGSDGDEGEEEEKTSFAVYDPHADQVVVYAKRDYGPGEELCERLGDMNVAESLQHFGYVPDVAEESPRNCVLMVLEPKKKKFEKNLRDAGFQVPWRVCVPFAAREQSLDLLAAYIEVSHGRHVDVDEQGLPQNVSRASLREFLRERVDRYPTTLSEDEAALESMRQSVIDFADALERQGMPVLEGARIEMKIRELRRSVSAVELRVREKKILRRLLTRLDSAAPDERKDEL